MRRKLEHVKMFRTALTRATAAGFLCFTAWVSVSEGALAAGKRVAFVVGNSAYQSVPALPNPKADASAVSEALRKSGFEVVTAIDLGKIDFEKAVEKFARSLNGADISLFYYSGHGVEVAGENRVVPIDATLEKPEDLQVQTLSLQTIMLYMQSRSRAQLIYLDACRDNPFPENAFLVGPDESKSKAGKGLAQQQGAIGSLIAYSTEPGNVAQDGTGDLSPFTDAVLRHSFVPDTDVQTALMKVTQDVWKSTGEKQRPWSNITLVEPVFLNGILVKAESPAAPKDVASPPPPKVEAAVEEVAADKATMGVGPQLIVPPKVVVELAKTEKVTVTKLPDAGVLMLDGAPLAEGATLKSSDVSKITYEPSPDTAVTETKFVLAPLEEAAPKPEAEAEPAPKKLETAQTVTKTISVTAKSSVNPCDEEAAEPLDGQGVTKGRLPNELDPEKALAACKQAVADFPDVPRFVFQLGRAELASKNIDAALEHFNKAAGLGHLRAINQLGYMYQRGIGVKQDIATANAMFKRAAEKGDVFAMLTYGRNLTHGRGVKQDVNAGLAYLNRAVEMGHTYAMNELGVIYMNGDPVKKNPKRAVRFYEASMARGDIYGIRNMALAYLEGTGVEKDAAVAMSLLKRASDGGHPGAPTDIGIMYFNGTGVKKSLDEAITWYKLGAERGNVAAASNLGWIYSEGPEDKRDVAKAVQYMALASALDVFGRDTSLAGRLAALPDKAKKKAVKELIKVVGADAAETAKNLDETLVLLARKAWQSRNPRVDLF